MSEYSDTKHKTGLALRFFEELEAMSCFEKQDVVAILNGFVELEVRRHMMKVKLPK